MTTYSSTFSAVGASSQLRIGLKEQLTLTLTCSGWTGQSVQLQRRVGPAWEVIETFTANQAATKYDLGDGSYRLYCATYDATAITYVLGDVEDDLEQWQNNDGRVVARMTETGLVFDATSTDATKVGAVAAVSGLTCEIKKAGSYVELDFTLDSVAVTHTDSAGSGSVAPIKLFDFVASGFVTTGTYQALSFLGDALIDGNVGDMAFKHGLGSVTANAGDGALTSTEVDIAAISSTVTLSSFVATSTIVTGAGAAVIDGVSAAKDIWFNSSGTAATSDANGVLTVSGTIKVFGIMLGAI